MSKMNLTQVEKNRMAVKYEALVNKMTYQFASKVAAGWDDVKSMAYEGLALAIEQYDEERSTMTFTQFAAFAIRNNILTCLDNELRTVKMSAYIQKKASEEGNSVFNMVRFDVAPAGEEDDSKRAKEMVMGIYEDAKFADGDVFETLYETLAEKFNKRDCEIFYRTFGLNGFEEEKCVDIAKMLNVSTGLISIINKRIVKYIRSNQNLCELLANL